ncbi:MAG: hypothetical protein KJ626_06525 [Verrucomicrobia bacterium]|nr:hypothetical protein [Verrucomicrobiota bacterium]
MHNKQGWTEKTREGLKREVRAVKHGPHWRIQAKVKGDEKWTYYDVPLLKDLEALHNLLNRKYNRGRCSFEEVERIGQMIADYDT